MDALGYVHAAMKVYDSLFQVYFKFIIRQCYNSVFQLPYWGFSFRLGQLSKYHHVRRAVQFGDVHERTPVL